MTVQLGVLAFTTQDSGAWYDFVLIACFLTYLHVKQIICHNYLVNISNLYDMLQFNVRGFGDCVIHNDIIEFHAFPSEHIYETFIYIFRFTTLVYFFFLFNNATFFNIQNIEDGKTYNLVMYAKSPETTDLTVSLTSADGSQSLASATVTLVIFLTFLGQEKIFVSS